METETVIRAFELPLRGGLAKESWPLLRECWSNTTDLANWCVQTLLCHDVMRTPTVVKLPKAPQVAGSKLKGLYGLASETFGFTSKDSWWSGACISAATICRDVEKAYKRQRYNALWCRNESLRLYRYPYPWPVHAQSWKACGFDASGKPWITINLPGGEVTLPLRGGPEFGRQMGHFRDMVKRYEHWLTQPADWRKKNLPWVAASIRQQACSTGCHRPHGIEKKPGGGQDRAMRVMVKMVAHIPVREKPGDRVLTLCTDPNAFWVAELDGRQAWILNNDHMKRMVAWLNAHEDRLDRLAQDSKAERRLCRENCLQINEFREKCCDKQHRRMHSWLHETAAHLVGYAVRQKVGHIEYRDQQQGFIERFPWYQLRQLLKDKCEVAGIRLDCSSDSEEVGDADNVVEVARNADEGD